MKIITFLFCIITLSVPCSVQQDTSSCKVTQKPIDSILVNENNATADVNIQENAKTPDTFSTKERDWGTLWIGAGIGFLCSILATIVLNIILRTCLSINKTIAKNGDDYDFLVENNGCLAALNVTAEASIVCTWNNGNKYVVLLPLRKDSTPRLQSKHKFNSSPEDSSAVFTLKDSSFFKKQWDVCTKPNSIYSNQRIRLIVTSVHPWSGITSCKEYLFNGNSIQEGNFVMGKFAPNHEI